VGKAKERRVDQREQEERIAVRASPQPDKFLTTDGTDDTDNEGGIRVLKSILDSCLGTF